MRPPMFCTCQVRSRNCSPVPGSRGFVPTLCYVLHAQRPCANHFRMITPGCTEESSSGCNSFRVSCEVPWTNCEDLSGTCVITEHSDSDWNGAVVTIAQSGCSATTTADKGKDEVVKAYMTVWPLAQGAGGAYTPLSGHSGGDRWTGSRDQLATNRRLTSKGHLGRPRWSAASPSHTSITAAITTRREAILTATSWTVE